MLHSEHEPVVRIICTKVCAIHQMPHVVDDAVQETMIHADPDGRWSAYAAVVARNMCIDEHRRRERKRRRIEPHASPMELAAARQRASRARQRFAACAAFLRQLGLLDAETTSLLVGCDHRHFTGMHPDDLEAAELLKQIFEYVGDDAEICREENGADATILFGSGASQNKTERFWEDLDAPLRITEIDGAAGMRFCGGECVSPDKKVLVEHDEVAFKPQVSRESGFQTSDACLLTYWRDGGRQVLSAAGLNGKATFAVIPLLVSPSLLAPLYSLVQGANCWQAWFRVTLSHDSNQRASFVHMPRGGRQGAFDVRIIA